MRVCLQRVSSASVTVDQNVVGQIDQGLLLLTGVGHDDTPQIIDKMAVKVANLRIFSDEDGKFNLSLLDVNGGALVVSQFTLYGDCKKGRRPSFVQAAPPDEADRLYQYFCQKLRDAGVPVETGRFQTSMAVSLVNDGPVTLILETPK